MALSFPSTGTQRTLFSAAARATPTNAKVRRFLGVLYLNRRDHERAKAEFEAAYRIYPQFPDLLGPMGLLYFRMGDWRRAEQFMENALRSSGGRDNPLYDEMAANYAALLMQTGRLEAALPILDRIIAESPLFSRAYSNRAVIHYRRNNWGTAQADAQAALQLDPENDQAKAVLSRISGSSKAGKQ